MCKRTQLQECYTWVRFYPRISITTEVGYIIYISIYSRRDKNLKFRIHIKLLFLIACYVQFTFKFELKITAYPHVIFVEPDILEHLLHIKNRYECIVNY